MSSAGEYEEENEICSRVEAVSNVCASNTTSALQFAHTHAVALHTKAIKQIRNTGKESGRAKHCLQSCRKVTMVNGKWQSTATACFATPPREWIPTVIQKISYIIV